MSEPTDPTKAPDTDPAQIEASSPEPTWRPSAGAQAASRARRIGGRPLPGPPGGDPSSIASPKPHSQAGRVSAERGSAVGVETGEAASPKTTNARRARQAPREVDPDTRDRRRRRLSWVPAGVAGLAVLAMLALGVWQSNGVWWGSRLHDNREQVQQQVLATAKPCTAAILSYDYRNIPAALAAGEKCVTGNLKTQYVQVMNQTVKVVAPQTKTVQTFQVAKAGISSVSADGKQWVVVVFGQETVTNSTTPAGSPRLDLSSAVVTLDKVNGQWVVSNLTNTGNGG